MHEHPLYMFDMCQYNRVRDLSIKDRRTIFADMRRHSEDALTATRFLPKHGMFLGEMCTYHVLLDIAKRKRETTKP